MTILFPRIVKDPPPHDEESNYGLNDKLSKQLYQGYDSKDEIVSNSQTNDSARSSNHMVILIVILSIEIPLYIVPFFIQTTIYYIYAPLALANLVLIVHFARRTDTQNPVKMYTLPTETLNFTSTVNVPEFPPAVLYQLLHSQPMPNSAATIDNDLTPRTIKFERGKNGKFGMYHNHNFIINVLADSPASQSGVKRGDQIIFVNGIDIETLSRKAITDLFERVTGEVTITLRYNPERLKEFDKTLKTLK